MTKKINLAFIISIFTLAFISCTTTEETTSRNGPTALQMQQFQEQQERRKEGAERSGLTADEIGILNDYAERKSILACQIIELDNSASQALSTGAEGEIKEAIINLDAQLAPLSKEIEEYCNNQSRQKYFSLSYNQYLKNCQQP